MSYLEQTIHNLTADIIFVCSEEARLEESVRAASDVILVLYVFACMSLRLA